MALAPAQGTAARRRGRAARGTKERQRGEPAELYDACCISTCSRNSVALSVLPLLTRRRTGGAQGPRAFLKNDRGGEYQGVWNGRCTKCSRYRRRCLRLSASPFVVTTAAVLAAVLVRAAVARSPPPPPNEPPPSSPVCPGAASDFVFVFFFLHAPAAATRDDNDDGDDGGRGRLRNFRSAHGRTPPDARARGGLNAPEPRSHVFTKRGGRRRPVSPPGALRPDRGWDRRGPKWTALLALCLVARCALVGGRGRRARARRRAARVTWRSDGAWPTNDADTLRAQGAVAALQLRRVPMRAARRAKGRGPGP
eukprot:scaffold2176_cov350-Prasinococcus_capsulatus_cf.AAC.15